MLLDANHVDRFSRDVVKIMDMKTAYLIMFRKTQNITATEFSFIFTPRCADAQFGLRLYCSHAPKNRFLVMVEIFTRSGILLILENEHLKKDIFTASGFIILHV